MTDMKLCILTGAAGEVGRATAKRFAESGWSMILCDRTAEIAGLAKDLSAEFGHACLGIQIVAEAVDQREADRAPLDAGELRQIELGLKPQLTSVGCAVLGSARHVGDGFVTQR